MKRICILIVVFVLLAWVGRSFVLPHTTAAPQPSSPPASHSADAFSAPISGHPSRSARSLIVVNDVPDESAKDDLTLPETLPGLIVAADRAAIRAAVSGIVDEFPVGRGDSVETGQPLAGINDGEVVAEADRQKAFAAAVACRVHEARAKLEMAQNDHRLKLKLAERRAVAPAEVTKAELCVKQATAALAALMQEAAVEEQQKEIVRQRLLKYRMTAPFAGHVTEILRHRDQYVGQGEIVMWVESHEKHLKLHVPAELVGALDRLRFSVAGPQQSTDLTVHSVDAHYNPDGSRTVLLDVGADAGLLAGQMIETEVTLQGDES